MDHQHGESAARLDQEQEQQQEQQQQQQQQEEEEEVMEDQKHQDVEHDTDSGAESTGTFVEDDDDNKSDGGSSVVEVPVEDDEEDGQSLSGVEISLLQTVGKKGSDDALSLNSGARLSVPETVDEGVEEEEEAGQGKDGEGEDGGDVDSLIEVPESASAVEVGVDEDASPCEIEDHLMESVYAPLEILVNDRMAESTTNLHAMNGVKLLWSLFWSLLACVVATVLTIILIATTRVLPTDSEGGFDTVLFTLVMRSIFSLGMTVVCIFYTVVVFAVLKRPNNGKVRAHKKHVVTNEHAKQKRKKSKKALEEAVEDDIANQPTRMRRDNHLVVLLMAWCAWLIPPLNPAMLAVDIYAFVLAKRANNILVFFNYWERQRYSTVATALFVASMFYCLIYLFKFYRLEAMKRERILRVMLNEPNHDAWNKMMTEEVNFGSVRSIKGVVPRIAFLYVLCRLAFGEGFDFDMGWVPGIAWISVARYCVLEPCNEYPVVARVSLIVLFNIWEFILLGWIILEAVRAKRILSLYYLLQGRTNLVSYDTMVALLIVNGFVYFLLGILIVASIPDSYQQYDQLSSSGVTVIGGSAALVVLSFMVSLCYLFLPCDLHFNPLRKFRICDWRKCIEGKPPPRTFHYVKSYNELVHNFSDPLDPEPGRRHHESTVGASGLLHQSNFEPVQSDAINRCLESNTSNIFSFDVAVLMWNFAHTMYLTGNAKYPQSDADVLLLIEDEHFALVAQIHDDTFDTSCGIFASSDMIIVAFRGNGGRIWSSLSHFRGRKVDMMNPFEIPTSMEPNPQDKGMDVDPQSDDVDIEKATNDPNDPDEVNNPEPTSCFMCRSDPPLVWRDLYLRYAAVSGRVSAVVEQLQEQKTRPVFFTGHGIGGSFATFCACDISRGASAMQGGAMDSPHHDEDLDNVDPPKYAVYTFGSPRCCNDKYREIYEQTVFNHFDIANVKDALHNLGWTEAFYAVHRSPIHGKGMDFGGYGNRRIKLCNNRADLVRLGTTVLVDSLGNLVIGPDWLEISIMTRSKRIKFNGHEPLAYTSGLMQWAHRMYGPHYRPLWTSSLHEVKLARFNNRRNLLNSSSNNNNNTRPTRAQNLSNALLFNNSPFTEREDLERNESWQADIVESYLATSLVGSGPYFDGASIRIKVLRITGLQAVFSSCIISCGPQGINSSLWEVGKTKPAELQRRSTLAGLDLMGPNHANNSASSSASSVLKANPHNKDLFDSNGKPMLRKSKSNLLGLGVDAEELANLPALFAEFDESDDIYFGVHQKLRPCSMVTIAGVDATFGNFGTANFPINKLFPIPNDKPKTIAFELTGRARKENSGELKVHLEIQSVGKIRLEDIVGGPSEWGSGSTSGNGSGLLRGPRYEEEPPEARPKIRLSPAMATFYLKRFFNPKSQRIVLRVGVMKAILHTLDMHLEKGTVGRNIFCELKLGNEYAKTRPCDDVSDPEWNELFVFGKNDTLTGFEELKVEIYVGWKDSTSILDPPMQLTRSTSSISHAMLFPSGSSSSLNPHRNGNSRLLGVIEMSFSAIITKYQGEVLVKWEQVEPIPDSGNNGSTSTITLDPGESPIKKDPMHAELPGHICLEFEVGTEAFMDNKNIARRSLGIMGGPGSSSDDILQQLNSPNFGGKGRTHGTGAGGSGGSSTGGGGVGITSATGARKRMPAMVRHASGSLRNFIGLAASPMANIRGTSGGQSGNTASLSSENLMTPFSRMRFNSTDDFGLISQATPDEWKILCENSFDERAYVVRVFVQRALNLDARFEKEKLENALSPSGGESILLHGGVDDNGSDHALSFDPFCEVSLLDPLNQFKPIQTKKTVIIRDSLAPIFEEEFIFGKVKENPVRGNEILCVAVHHWELETENLKFGEVRIPIYAYRDRLNVKQNIKAPLEFYDENNEVIPQPSSAAPEVQFVIMINEFVKRDIGKNGPDDSKSPML